MNNKLLKCKKNNILSTKYIIFKNIGSGSFGEVYIAEYNKNNKKKCVAAKVEARHSTLISKIMNEYNIYEDIRSKGFRHGIPKIYEFIQTPDYNIMLMELLGPNLEYIFDRCNRKFKLTTVLLLAMNIILLLRDLHNINYIHRDIKPSNFLIGRKNKNNLYIMDFGLSRKYITNDRHIAYRNKKSLVGTARYASINMHKGIEPTRRDELESVGYMLIYFLKGILPWQHLTKVKNKKPIDVIGEKKMNTTFYELCGGLPKCFRNYIIYCRKLKFSETPDYNYMYNLFYNYCVETRTIPSYEWVFPKETGSSATY
uniref:non-specific serine/threonine protein kinase n=1 Tax=Mimivirus LCMiAC02 TaxID=2506609 RepID=A0A481Z0H7_9VIRU|nr:MAG: serine/threonine protein kinase [Mimivirus LCMiAC02]